MKEEKALSAAWTLAWSRLNARPPLNSLLDVISAYDSRAGGYHDLSHLRHVVGLAMEQMSLFQNPGEAFLALFYHDVIYDPKRPDNEQRSADMAATVMQQAGARQRQIASVRELVLATRHDAIPGDHDAKLVVDIDLSILGADEEKYRRYMRGVRKEYAHVPEFLFRHGRRKLMTSFLERESIYQTDVFRKQFETKARENIDRELRGAFE